VPALRFTKARVGLSESMTTVRLYSRLAMLTVWTLGVFACRMALKPLSTIAPEAELRYRGMCVRTWGRGMLHILNAKVTISGNPPQRPFFLVSNHQTLLDMVLLWAVTDTAYVSKHDIADWPVIGTMARGMNTIFINRENIRDTARVNELIHHALDERLGITMFAEGGCGDGTQVLPFKPPLLQPVAIKGVPVHYATINYSTPQGCPPPGTVMVWRQGVSFTQYCADVMRLPGFDATIDFGSAPLAGNDRKKLASELWEKVKERYVPVAPV
jgi:1-acyl-sn-glycerol-3-phosphate acyltransferase